MQAASLPGFRGLLSRIVPFAFIVVVACSGAGEAAAQAQNFPTRPLRIIVPFPPGGSVDEAVRIVGPRLTEVTGQNVIIDNRPGASGNLGTDLAARAAADGHTVLATTLPLVVNPSLFSKLNHDVLRDFAPVSLLAAAPFVMVVHPTLPVSSVREFIAYARARPGELNYASAGSGTNLHVAAELFKSVGKVDVVHVPYKGGGPALAAMLGGETHVSFIGVLPEFSSWYGMLAPRGVPGQRVVALNGHLRNALRSAEMEGRFARARAEIIASTPDAFGRHLRAELAKWAKVVKAAGLKAE